MKNKIYIFTFVFLFFSKVLAENLEITAKNITLDKDKVTTVFENDVIVKTKQHLSNRSLRENRFQLIQKQHSINEILLILQ